MDVTQWLLCKVAEEAAEVGQRAMKAQQFGIEEVQEGQGKDNLERLRLEVNDLILTYNILLNHLGHNIENFGPTKEEAITRYKKLHKFLQLSKSLNMVTGEFE